MLRLKSLGQTLIEVDDARLTPAAETVFATALYLIIETGRPIGRDELTRLFWPGVSETQAQHGLRQVLYRLKTLGATIKADRAALILAPRFCATDFAPLLAPQSPAELELLASNIGGSFLPGYRPQLSDEFGSWVERQRDIVHSALSRVLVGGMQAKKRVSDWNGAERFASLCLTMDPLNEEATLTVAEAAALGGSKTKALTILNRYLEDIGENASEIKLPAVLLRRRISEAYQNNIFPVRDAPFVGREEEMTELTAALARAQTGNGSTYVISGEPGIGKTRLVQEFTRVAALQRVHIVRVGCQSHDVRRPLSAFVDLVPKLLALPGALGCSPESMQYLRRLTAHDPEEVRERDLQVEGGDGVYRAARKALVDLFDAVSGERCCLLEIEDIQWLDPQSALMAEEIANWIATHRILLLLTSRIPAFSGEPVRSIALRSLHTAARSRVAAQFVASDGRQLDSAFLEWCVSSSGGNPFYLLELLREGTTEHHGFRAPESLGKLLHSRVLALSVGARRLLEVCCVLGKHSTLERITACIQLPRETILGAVEELDRDAMVIVDGSRAYCRHDLLSAVVIEHMSAAVRALLHRYIAADLESEFDITHSVSLMWESAEHWLLAADSRRAVESLRRCGNYLMDVGLPDEAAEVLQRAESLAVTVTERYLIGTERARALMRAERSRDAGSVLEDLLRLRQSICPLPSPLDEAGVMSLEARWQNGESVPELAGDCLLALASENATPEECVSAARWLVTAADNMCDSALGQRIYERIESYILTEDLAVDSRLSFLMVYHCCSGDGDLAVDFARELAEYARRRSPPTVALRYLRHVAHVIRCHADAEEALLLAEESCRIAMRYNSGRALMSSAYLVASTYMQIGDNDSASQWIEKALASYAPGDITVTDANLCSYKAELAIRKGEIHSAERFLASSLPSAERFKSTRSRARAISLTTQLGVLKGERTTEDGIRQLFEIFDIVKNSTFQDYTVESILLGLMNEGRERDAALLAYEYTTVHRRDRSALSVPLAKMLDKVTDKLLEPD
jgi:DNA-binding SARP family transcriptional activator/tetratricopeptide (TPR) repeat protein